MRKIRIGNDIRLKLTIKPSKGFGIEGFDNFFWDNRLDEFDQSNIKQLRCYLINTSFCKPCRDKGCKCQRIGFPDFYHPTHHNINNTGFPGYHMAPANMCNYDRFTPDFHDFHWWPGYRGFGIYPDHFHEHCGHMHWHGPRPSNFYPCCHNHHMPVPPMPPCPGCKWPEPYEPLFHGYDHHGIEHCKPEPFDTVLHPEYVPVDVFGKENVVLNHPHPYTPFYLCDSQVLEEKNKLTCMFPAVQQKMCGIYKLVVVLTVFEQGWGRHNLRTYTIDKGDVFELVDCGGDSGPITIDIDSTGERENLIAKIWTEESEYRQADDSILHVGQFDLDDKQYTIYVELKDGTTVIYTPDDWRYNKLVFESDRPEILQPDDKGHLHAAIVEKPEVCYITVRSADGDPEDPENNPTYTFKVTVVPTEFIYLGFDPISNPDAMEVTNPNLDEYSTRVNKYSIMNSQTEWGYLWVFSQKKIHYIKSIEDGLDKVSELSSGFRVPMNSYGKKDNFFLYRSAAPILPGKMNIKIIFE